MFFFPMNCPFLFQVSPSCNQVIYRWTSTRPACRRLPIVHHDDYVCTLPAKHRFPMSKFTKVCKYLLHDGVIRPEQVVRPTMVTAESAGSVHTLDYIDKFFGGKTSEKEQRRTGFVWTEGLVKRCRMETGKNYFPFSMPPQKFPCQSPVPVVMKVTFCSKSSAPSSVCPRLLFAFSRKLTHNT